MFNPLNSPKTIKLENYPAIYNAVLYGLENGGTVDNLNAGTLFEDLNTNRPLQITFKFFDINVKVTGVTVARPANSANPTQLSMNAIMQLQDALLRITIIINRDGDDVTSVSVIHG